MLRLSLSSLRIYSIVGALLLSLAAGSSALAREQAPATAPQAVKASSADKSKDKPADGEKEAGDKESKKDKEAQKEDKNKKKDEAASEEEGKEAVAAEKKSESKDEKAEAKSDAATKSAAKKEADAEEKAEDEEAASEKKSEKPAAKPYVVKRKPLKIEQELDGVFVAKQMHEVAIRPETWGRFVVAETVEHGTEVKKGDLLVRFDPEPLEDRLADEDIDLRLGELDLMLKEEETPREEKLLEIAYQEAKRAARATRRRPQILPGNRPPLRRANCQVPLRIGQGRSRLAARRTRPVEENV